MADIKDIHEGATVLGEFGIKVVGQVESSSDLPDPTEYDGEYGDAYVVGEEAPYDYYIFTRPFEDVDDPQWFNLGQFPAPGPQGASITDVDLNSSNQFVTTLSNGQTINTGTFAASRLYRHVIAVPSDYSTRNRVITFEVIDDKSSAYNLATLFTKYKVNSTTTSVFQSTGTIAASSDTVGLMQCYILKSGSAYYIAGKSSDGNTYQAYITGQEITDTVYGLTLAVAKGDPGTAPEITMETPITTTLSPGLNATASVTSGGTLANPTYTFSFGIPQGVQGIQGPQGIQGIQGPQGPQGIQGQKGDTGYLYTIIGQVNNESSLPLPGQVGRTSAFLVGTQEPYDVYIIIGQDLYDLEWLNIGPIATVVPTTYIASDTDASSGTLDATTLAAITNETGVHYIRVGSELYEYANTYNGNAYYMSLRYDSSISRNKIARFIVALSSGAWTTNSDLIDNVFKNISNTTVIERADASYDIHSSNKSGTYQSYATILGDGNGTLKDYYASSNVNGNSNMILITPYTSSGDTGVPGGTGIFIGPTSSSSSQHSFDKICSNGSIILANNLTYLNNRKTITLDNSLMAVNDIQVMSGDYAGGSTSASILMGYAIMPSMYQSNSILVGQGIKGAPVAEKSSSCKAIFGRYNDPTDLEYSSGNVFSGSDLFQVGCGTADNARANCFATGNDGTHDYIKIGDTKLSEDSNGITVAVPYSLTISTTNAGDLSIGDVDGEELMNISHDGYLIIRSETLQLDPYEGSLYILDLPTSDPNETDAIWNNSGVLMKSGSEGMPVFDPGIKVGANLVAGIPFYSYNDGAATSSTITRDATISLADGDYEFSVSVTFNQQGIIIGPENNLPFSSLCAGYNYVTFPNAISVSTQAETEDEALEYLIDEHSGIVTLKLVDNAEGMSYIMTDPNTTAWVIPTLAVKLKRNNAYYYIIQTPTDVDGPEATYDLTNIQIPSGYTLPDSGSRGLRIGIGGTAGGQINWSARYSGVASVQDY